MQHTSAAAWLADLAGGGQISHPWNLEEELK
jgi:hypothetical protein